MLTRRNFACAALMLAMTAGAARADVAYGTDPFANGLFQVDLSTGALSTRTLISLTGFAVTGATALTAHPTTGALYGIVKTAAGQGGRKLVTIDPGTGNATLVGDVPNGFSTLSFNSAGTLYGMTGQGGTPASTLYTLSTVNAAATTVFGPVTTGADGEVIGFGPGNILYHSSGNASANYSTINLGPNTTTLLGTAAGEMFGMGYSSGLGTMFGTTIVSELVRINLTNGARTVVGSMVEPGGFGIDLRGLAIVVPAPGAGVLLGLGGLIAMRRRRATA